jgi:hypothetical protein
LILCTGKDQRRNDGEEKLGGFPTKWLTLHRYGRRLGCQAHAEARDTLVSKLLFYLRRLLMPRIAGYNPTQGGQCQGSRAVLCVLFFAECLCGALCSEFCLLFGELLLGVCGGIKFESSSATTMPLCSHA